MLMRRRDVAFALVLVWAFVGIGVAQADRSGLTAVVTAVAAAILAVWAARTALRGADTAT